MKTQPPAEDSKDENNVSTESKRSKRPPKATDQGDDDSATFDHKQKLKIPDRRDLVNKDEQHSKDKGLAKTASEGNMRPSSSTTNMDEVIRKVDKE